MAELLHISSISDDLQLIEEAMGKETILQADELPALKRQAWRSNNAQLFKFLLKIKRGSAESAQLKWRDAIYK